MTELLLVAAAFVAAALSGALGLGGGTLLIAMLFATGMPPAQAVPLFAIVQAVANATRSLRYWRAVDAPAIGWFVLASLPVAVLCAPLVTRVEAHWVAIALGALIALSLLPLPGPGRLPRGNAAFVTAGVLNGSAGMFIGATGLITGRLLVQPDWPRTRVVGTVAVTQTLAHLIKLPAFVIAGVALFAQPMLLAAMCAAAVLGTGVGTRLGEHLPEARFRQVFTLVLAALAIHLLIDGILTACNPY